MAKYLRRHQPGTGISSSHRYKETYLLTYMDSTGKTKEFKTVAKSRYEATNIILSDIRQNWPQGVFEYSPTLLCASVISKRDGVIKLIYVNDMSPSQLTSQSL